MLKNLQILRGYLFPNVHIYIGLRIRVHSAFFTFSTCASMMTAWQEEGVRESNIKYKIEIWKSFRDLLLQKLPEDCSQLTLSLVILPALHPEHWVNHWKRLIRPDLEGGDRMLQIFALCCLIIGVSFMFYFRNLSPFIFHRLVCIKRVGGCRAFTNTKTNTEKNNKGIENWW